MRFSEVDIKGLAEEATVKGKNIVAQLIEIRDGFECLTSCLTFMKSIVGTVTLCILKCPNGRNSGCHGRSLVRQYRLWS